MATRKNSLEEVAVSTGDGVEAREVLLVLEAGAAEGVELEEGSGGGPDLGQGIEIAAIGGLADLHVTPEVVDALVHAHPAAAATSSTIVLEAQDPEVGRVVDHGLDPQHAPLVVELEPVLADAVLDTAPPGRTSAKPRFCRREATSGASAWAACPLRNPDRLNPDKLGFQVGLTVLKQHGDDLLEVALQLIQARALAVGTRPARDVAYVEASVGVSLDYDAEATQSRKDTRVSGSRPPTGRPRLSRSSSCRPNTADELRARPGHAMGALVSSSRLLGGSFSSGIWRVEVSDGMGCCARRARLGPGLMLPLPDCAMEGADDLLQADRHEQEDSQQHHDADLGDKTAASAGAHGRWHSRAEVEGGRHHADK
jgi:hypothetical protein